MSESMNWSGKVLALRVCDSHQPRRQASTLHMNQGPERLNCLAPGHISESGRVWDRINHPLPFSAHTFPKPDPLPSLPLPNLHHPIPLQFPCAIMRNTLSASYICCKSSSPNTAWALGKKNEGGREEERALPGSPPASPASCAYSGFLTTCRAPHSACTGVPPSSSLPTQQPPPASALGPLPGADGEEEPSGFSESAQSGWGGMEWGMQLVGCRTSYLRTWERADWVGT